MDLPVPLPPIQIRQGGGAQLVDETFLGSALDDVEMLRSVGLDEAGSVLDFGCGPGRIAIGLITSGWTGSYLGVEVKDQHVKWATAEITSRYPDYEFVRVDAAHARYNPGGDSAARRLPIEDASTDLIFAFSVFSHMLTDDTTTYLREFRRALTADGKALITVFMAEGIPDETENPAWYGKWSGSLHCVLYSTEYLERLIVQEGLTLERVIKREGRRQDSLVLRPN